MRKYPELINAVSYNINEYGQNISAYEKNLLAILPFFRNVDELEYMLRMLKDYDSNIIHNLFEVLQFLKPYQITSFKLFIENGGKDVLESIRRYKEVNTGHEILLFCNRLISKTKPKDYKELLRLFNTVFIFINKEVKDNRIKLKQIDKINSISESIFRHFGDYLFYIMENSPKNFMKILINTGNLVQIEAEVSKEILQIAKIARTFRLMVNENRFERINPQDIENTYLFLVGQLGKKPNIDKLRKNLNKFGTQHSKSAFEWINMSIMNLSIEYFTKFTTLKIRDTFEKYCGVPLPSELYDNDDTVNALLIAKKCTRGKNEKVAKIFIRELCLKNTVPFKKYPEAYPFNQPKNIEFMRKMQSRGVNLYYWVHGFKKGYEPLLTDALKNTEKIIADHISEVIKHYKELGLVVEEKDIFDKFKDIKENPNQNLVLDIKQHLQAIQSLRGKKIFITTTKKVTIYIETDPLKVLQMGNVVIGSCLRLGGGYEWTTITNALDINKRVLYAENEKRVVLGRRLTTMTDNGHILQYGVYNNTPEIDLNTLFEKFTIELAELCKTNVADSGETSTLVGERWYAGTAILPFESKKTEISGRVPKPRPRLVPQPSPI